MQTWAWIVLIALTILLIAALIFGGWVVILKQPHPGRDCHKHSDWMWSPDCKYFEEKFYDSSLADPSDLQLYLVKFSRVSGAGSVVCLPMWYCFRYVNVKTGGYSKFSKWTSAPIRAGGDNLPCLGKCNPDLVPEGRKSCYFNQPAVGTPDLHYDPLKRQPEGTFIYTNIHRYVGKPGDTEPPGPPEETKTEIIGFLIPTRSVPGIKYAWNDILFNPCKENPPGCGRCRGC